MKYAMVHADVNKGYEVRKRFIPPSMTGLFVWLDVFKGTLMGIRDYFTGDADIVHINICKATLPYPRLIRSLDKDVIIVCNLDYDVDLLPVYGGIKPFVDAMNDCDHIFTNTISQKDALSHVIAKPLHFIPHPCDIEGLKALRKPIEEREGIGLMVHSKYNQHEDIATLVAVVCKQETHLYHVTNPVDSKVFDYVWPPIEYSLWIRSMKNRMVGFDLHRDLAYGRFQCDSAGLGVPCIGPLNVESQSILFPDLTLPHHNAFADGVKLNYKLHEDPEFYKGIVAKADKALEFYSYDECRKQFLKMIEGKEVK